jgi:hypothetical protein
VLSVGYAASSAGLTTTLHFTRRVFRPGRGLPFAYAFASGAAIWTGWLGYVVSGDVAQGRFEGAWFWLMTGGMSPGKLGAFELIPQLRRRGVACASRRCGPRDALGLGPPRARSWYRRSPAALHSSPKQRLPTGDVLVMSSLRPVTGTYWLAFQPPRAYLRWVEARAVNDAA